MRRKSVRRSLPGVIVEDGMLADDYFGRECMSLDNSPQPLDELEGEPEQQQQQQPELLQEQQQEQQQQPQQLPQQEQRRAGGRVRRDLEEAFKAPGLVRHESLPSLHLNARCIKCDAMGIIYCKGCEAHFCARHDQRRHRFLLRKNRHEHQAVPGISYFRIPLPNDAMLSPPLSSEGSDDQSPIPPPVGHRGVRAGGGLRQRDVELDISGSSGSSTSGASGAAAGGARGAGGSTAVLDRRRRAGGAAGGGGGGGGGGARWAEARSLPGRAKSSRSAIDLARSGWYNKIVMAIVRPPRCKYSVGDLGNEVTPLSSGLAMKRRDFEVRNQRGLKLVCSQWRPAFTEDTSKLPCVVYLHGNSSARVDVVKTSSLRVLGTAACTVVSFDFSGSGMSEGEFVTLGYFEQHDVADVLAYLRSNGMASRYLLWGRSMGAASALLYAARYPNHDLCGLILDSPFCSFKRLARDLVTEGQVNVPGFLVNGALGMLRHSVKKRTRCDLKTVAPITRARHIRCPCLFIAARKDVMVRPSHGADLSEAVGGASLFITCKGSHNTARPGVVLQAVGTFVKGCFQAPGTPISQAFSTIQTALQEAQATAAALRAGRGSTSSASSSVTAGGGGGGSRRGRVSTTSARQRARATSASSDLDVGASDPGLRVVAVGDGRGRGRDSGAGSRPGPARPLARPGPRREAEMERARRITSAATGARKSLSHSESPAPDRKSRKASRHDAYNRRRSKSHDEDVVDRQDCGGDSISNDPDGRRRRGGDGDGSYVLEVGESPSFDLAADGELGPDGEVRAVTVERRPGGGGGGGSTGASASSGGRGILPTKLQECPYPPRRPGQRQTAAAGGGDVGGGGGGTGELSPYPSPPPSSSSSRAGTSSTTLEQGGWRKTAHANPTAAGTTARNPGAPGQRRTGAVALLFPPPRPPPPPSQRRPTAGGSGVPSGKVPAPAKMAAPAGVAAPVDDSSSEGGAQGRPRQSYTNGRENCSGEGGTGGGGGAAAPAAAPPPPRSRQNVRRPSNSSRSGRGSGWLGLGQVRLAAPALSSVFRSNNRSSGKRRVESSGPVRGFPLDRSSDGSSGGVKRSPGAQRQQRGACTCGNGPAECLCYVGGDLRSSEMMRRGGGQDKTMAPPLHMRTASGKLKM
ncbi:unnamed protein product [Ectocarpus sp. 12 AP-2014]